MIKLEGDGGTHRVTGDFKLTRRRTRDPSVHLKKEKKSKEEVVWWLSLLGDKINTKSEKIRKIK